jgi:alanine racemase
MPEGTLRPTWAEIDLDALAANVRLLREVAAPAALCAVVKADGYGHGAVAVARSALDAGATWLAVAVVDEAVALRDAGITAPILLLSDPVADAVEATLAHSVTPTLSSRGGVAALGRAAERLGVQATVHLKIDTGMHRLGVVPEAVGELVEAALDAPGLGIGGVFTHLAVADGDSPEDREFTDLQLRRFEQALKVVRSQGVEPGLRHAANSAATIAYPSSRYDLVRTGIAIYGEVSSPFVGEALAAATGGRGLEPVLALHSRVVALRRLTAGERPSYGRLRPLSVDSLVATVPIGYADGVPRRFFSAGGEVLIGGRRRPLAGVVTMDQMVVDCGGAGDVEVGDEVVLLGRQGSERITVSEWAGRLGTINHEVLTLIGARVPRVTSREAKALRDGGLPGGQRPQ